ncbi:hypothetical protein FLO80_11275 [Aquicoccus porphyridii]|uniref:Uncharacterized protein n=1 Tax=Aquicoccus porphyridii TaxID=1852029 RepID=A0A5A9ZD85_9RHOB|nr:hypothetical protein FLO80_11275 [Aquicoccus porphyridii]RAI52514.1 hypothetical protein DOO74_16980 [Rhodobacteraceae bacterium AsT-22]
MTGAQGHVQMVTRMMVHGQSPQAASDAPRWRFVSGRRVALGHASHCHTGLYPNFCYHLTESTDYF